SSKKNSVRCSPSIEPWTVNVAPLSEISCRVQERRHVPSIPIMYDGNGLLKRTVGCGRSFILRQGLEIGHAQSLTFVRPCTHKPGGVMRLKQCLLCPYSDRLRAATQYVAMGHNRPWFASE